MALKGKPVAISNSSTNIYTCPSGVEAAVHGLLFSNNTGSPLAVDVIVYNQADGAETTVATDLAVAANSYITWTKPVNLNAGDVIKAVSSAVSGLVCLYSVYEGSSAPVATGFTGRGVWSSGSTYAVNDIVTTAAGTYLALQASTNKDPATETAYWMFLQGVSASALPSQSGQTGKFLTTDGTDASWAAISSESIRKALPLKSGKTLTAGRAVNINSSGEVGDYPVVNTLGTLVQNTTTTYRGDIGWLSTDGSRALQLLNDGVASSGAPYSVRGIALTSTTQTTGSTVSLGASGGYNVTAQARPINETQFLVVCLTISGTDYYANPTTMYYTSRVATVDSSGNVTLGTANVATISDMYLGYGFDFHLSQLPSGRFALLANGRATGSASYVYVSRTFSISGSTITSTSDTDLYWYSTYPSFVTTNNKLVGVYSDYLWYCNYDGTVTSTYSYVDLRTNARGGATTGTMLNANYGLVAYNKSNFDFVLETFSINQTTGVPTTTSTYVVVPATAVAGNDVRFAIISSTEVVLVYRIGTNTYALSLKLNANAQVIGRGIPVVINNVGDAVWDLKRTASNGTRYNYNNSNYGYTRDITINTYDTLSWVSIGATSTSQTASPAEIVTGGVCSGFTGLTAGSKYYVNEATYDGQVTTTQGSYLVGTAISSTEILLG